MRSALTYRFAMVPTRGKVHWHQDATGIWKGNPSLSFQVSHYMLSLKRRKVRFIYCFLVQISSALIQDGVRRMRANRP